MRKATMTASAVRFRIAGVTVQVGCVEEASLAELAERFVHFVDDERDTQPECRVELSTEPLVGSGGRIAEAVQRGEVLEVWRNDFELELSCSDDRWRCTGRILPGAVRALDSAVRVTLGAALCDRRMFLIHASGVSFGGRAAVLFGPSGVGKTTFAGLALARGAHLLGDDLVAVEAAGNQATVWGTPFAGGFGVPRGRPSRAPAGGFFALAHGRNELEPRGLAAATAALAGSVVCYRRDRPGVTQVFDTVAKVARRTPVYRFAFRPDSESVALIEQIVGR